MRFLIGWLVHCFYPNDPPEVEGEVFFDHDPEIGEGMVLTGGQVYQITNVRPWCFELDAKQPELGYGAF